MIIIISVLGICPSDVRGRDVHAHIPIQIPIWMDKAATGCFQHLLDNIQNSQNINSKSCVGTPSPFRAKIGIFQSTQTLANDTNTPTNMT